jgi:hypothetical protein
MKYTYFISFALLPYASPTTLNHEGPPSLNQEPASPAVTCACDPTESASTCEECPFSTNTDREHRKLVACSTTCPTTSTVSYALNQYSGVKTIAFPNVPDVNCGPPNWMIDPDLFISGANVLYDYGIWDPATS